MASNFRIDATGDIHFSSGAAGGIYLDSDVSFFNTRKLTRDSQPSNLVFVQDLDDLPTPDASGVITLAPSTCYYICKEVDLSGNRLETSDEKTTITGSSSETSFLTSTGLGAGVPLITSRYTLPITNITLKDVDTGFYIDDDGGANAPLAIDWARMNFSNVPHIGEFGTCDNIIFDTCAFLSSADLKLTGSVGTFGFQNSLVTNFTGTPSIDLSGCEFTRRFKATSSSFVNGPFAPPGSSGAAKAIRVADISLATGENFILDTVNFSRPGIAGYPLDGITQADVQANFVNCNIQNSASVGDVYITGNTVATTITTVDEPVCLDPSINSTNVNAEKFVFEPGIHGLRYVSGVPKTFLISLNASLSTGPNQDKTVGVYIAKADVSNVSQGAVVAADVDPSNQAIEITEIYNTTSSARDVSVSTQYLTVLNKDEVIYPTVENITDTEAPIVSFMNMVIQKTSE